MEFLASFAELEKTWRAELEQAMANVSNEDADYWREQAAKKIRGPVRRWLAQVLVHASRKKLPEYLRRLPDGWQERTEVLFDPPPDKPTTGNAAAAVAEKTAQVRIMVPKAEDLAKNAAWQRWLDEFSETTGQELKPPYLQHWRPGWKSMSAAAAALAGIVLAVARPWRG